MTKVCNSANVHNFYLEIKYEKKKYPLAFIKSFHNFVVKYVKGHILSFDKTDGQNFPILSHDKWKQTVKEY